jgi:hypothetical protein
MLAKADSTDTCHVARLKALAEIVLREGGDQHGKLGCKMDSRTRTRSAVMLNGWRFNLGLRGADDLLLPRYWFFWK